MEQCTDSYSRAHAMTHDQFLKNKYFDSLTGLRAIAVVLVLINHYAGDEGAFLCGWLGVQIFFVLSGFLITTLLLRENEEKGNVSFAKFYIRRVFRIFPVYYLWFALVLWQAFNIGGVRWKELHDAFPYYLTFFNELVGETSWRLTWTLGVEWKFYLVWPVLAFAIARSLLTRFLVAIVILVVLVALWGKPVFGLFQYTVLLEGAILALLMHSKRGYRFIEPITGPVASTIIFALFALLQYNIGTLHAFVHGGMQDAWFQNIYGLAVCFLLPAIIGNGLPRRLLSSRPFVFVGQRSYSLYLIQISVAEAMSGFAIWHKWDFAFTAMVFAAGLIVADVLYRYVEKPMIKFGHRAEAQFDRLQRYLSPMGPQIPR